MFGSITMFWTVMANVWSTVHVRVKTFLVFIDYIRRLLNDFVSPFSRPMCMCCTHACGAFVRADMLIYLKAPQVNVRCFPYSFLKQSLIESGARLGWMNWQWSQESAFLHLPTTGIVVHAIDNHVRDLNSGCDACSLNTFPTSAGEQHLNPTDHRIEDWTQYFSKCCTTKQYLHSEKWFLLHLILPFIYNVCLAGLLEFEIFFLITPVKNFTKFCSRHWLKDGTSLVSMSRGWLFLLVFICLLFISIWKVF